MLNQLLQIYRESKLNTGTPESIFNPTEIFNEGWMLRGILKKWREWNGDSKFPFLSYPENVNIYSEGQLYTPFRKRAKRDREAEDNTHIDGIVGNFQIQPGSKTGIVLEDDFEYFAVFEAKMYSGIPSGITHIKNYNQVTRTIACMINSVLNVERGFESEIHFVVLSPYGTGKIHPNSYTKDVIASEIQERIKLYKDTELVDKTLDHFITFEKEWRNVLDGINIQFIHWEDILKEIDDSEIQEFYDLCKTFCK